MGVPLGGCLAEVRGILLGGEGSLEVGSALHL